MAALTEKEVLSVLEEALALDVGSRPGFVNRRCSGSLELRRRVEELLDGAQESGPLPQFLVPRQGGAVARESAIVVAEPLRTAASCGEGADSIGPYRLLDVLGEGGMGVVYLAEQLRPRRRVAVKVIHPRLLSSETSRYRFEREVQLLGRLDHPGIARIYESGTESVGARAVPFIAMEFVDGESLRKYVQRTRPSLTAKLALVAKLADAVHSAHQKAVVHRDLNPGNVLITRGGEPKVLDFGIAASTDDDVERAQRTQEGELLGTLAYMSPEQARGDIDAIDARSDIYALGLIAFEVLTGKPAFEVTGAPIDVLVRGLERAEPKALGRVDPSLKGDVEAIVSKACREEPSARYDSAAELASDIRRFIDHRPVSARPLSRAYELRKFVRRNRVVVGGSVLLALSLVGGLVFSLVERGRANRNEALALDRADALELSTEFQSRRLSGIDVAGMAHDFRKGLIQEVRDASPTGMTAAEIEARVREFERLLSGADFAGLSLKTLQTQIFEPALEEVNDGFQGHPLDQARLFQTIATTLRELGLLDEAVAPQARALWLRTSEADASLAEVLASKSEMGVLLLARGDFDGARLRFEEVLEIRRGELGDEHPETLASMNHVASALWSLKDHEGARKLQEEALKVMRTMHGEERPEILSAMNNLASTLRDQEDHAGALELLGLVLDVRRRVLGGEHQSTLATMSNYALTLWHQDDFEGAQEMQEEVLEARQRLLGDEHPETLTSMNNFAASLASQGDQEGAQKLHEKVLEARRRVLGNNHPYTLTSMNNLASTLKVQGDFAGAGDLLEEVLEVRRRVQGREDSRTLILMGNLAAMYKEMGEKSRARELVAEALTIASRALGEEDDVTKRLAAFLVRLES